jgi:Asp-tRNA(Asn)/Glu-tRNA(Gln) amidotransferase A subunit family amidase
LAQPTELDCDAAMRDAFDAAVARAATHTGDLVPTVIDPLLEAGQLLYHGPWVAERLAELETFFARHPDDVLPIIRQVIEEGLRFTAADTFRAWHRLKELQHWTDQLWRRTDLLIMPTVPTTFRAASPGVALGYLFAALVCLAFSLGSAPAPAELPDEHLAARTPIPQHPAPAEVATEPAH